MATDVRPQSATSEPSIKRSASPGAIHSPQQPTQARWGRLLIAILAITILGVGVTFMSGAMKPKASGPKLTHTIGRRDIEVSVTEQGALESSNNTEVRCKVKGPSSTIVWIVENGSVVKPGDLLVKIDTSTIETNINTQEIAYQNALATFAQSKSDVEVAEINVIEYTEGTFRSELKTKEKDVAIAEANLRSAKNMLNHAKEMYRKGFMSQLELEGNKYSLIQAELELEVKETDVDVLKRYSKQKQIKDLSGILAAKRAKLASDEAALKLEKSKLDREKEQLENCIVNSKTNGMVIYKEHEEWEDKPDIREGATVREDQVLLLIPDLEKMQVKVGIHEARIDQIKIGMRAEVTLQDINYEGKVDSVAPMAERGGWWNGNMVKYETTIKLDTKVGLKPGMSATTKVFLAEHKDVLAIPVAAVVDKEGQYFCWGKVGSKTERRAIDLGVSDDQFLLVNSGVTEGDEVVINPIAHVEEARKEALQPYNSDAAKKANVGKSNDESKKAPTTTPAKTDDAKGSGSASTESPTADVDANDPTSESTEPQAGDAKSTEPETTQSESPTTDSPASDAVGTKPN